eukprot:540019-Pelagomonas_calceolata.AAC.1
MAGPLLSGTSGVAGPPLSGINSLAPASGHQPASAAWHQQRGRPPLSSGPLLPLAFCCPQHAHC